MLDAGYRLQFRDCLRRFGTVGTYVIIFPLIIIIILILHLSVSTSGRSREGHLIRAKNFYFSSSLDLDVTCSSSLTQLAMVQAATKVNRFERAAGQN